MKKILIMLTGLLLLVGVAHANQFRAEKKTGDITVRASMDSNPVKVGDNNITIKLHDKSGKVISDAEVSVYYFMPSMPAMNYEVKALPDGAKYAAVIKVVMPGAWDADIKVKRSGEELHKATISFNAK